MNSLFTQSGNQILKMTLFSSDKGLMCIIKKNERIRNVKCFRETALTNEVVLFLRISENAVSVEKFAFLHDKKPCFKILRVEDCFKTVIAISSRQVNL